MFFALGLATSVGLALLPQPEVKVGNGASRRAVLASGLYALALKPSEALARTTTASVASGYVAQKSPAEVKAEVKATFVDPFVAAYTKGDWDALSSLYIPDAIIVDGTTRQLTNVRGADIGAYLSKTPLVDVGLTIVKLTPEVEYDGGELQTIHTQIDFTHAGGRFRVYRRLVKVDAGWKVAAELYPLDAPKAYALLKPKRDVFGNVYMTLTL